MVLFTRLYTDARSTKYNIHREHTGSQLTMPGVSENNRYLFWWLYETHKCTKWV